VRTTYPKLRAVNTLVALSVGAAEDKADRS